MIDVVQGHPAESKPQGKTSKNNDRTVLSLNKGKVDRRGCVGAGKGVRCLLATEVL